MVEYHTYQGHEIAVELIHVGPKQVRWVWRIDGRHHSKSSATSESEDVARSEALLYAKIMVARLRRVEAVAAGR